jgi:hypothetical protein
MSKSPPAHKLAVVEVEKDDHKIIAIEVTWAGEVITISNDEHPLPPEIDRLASQLLTQVRKDYGNANH